VEAYVLAFDVTGLAAGLYHYAPLDDGLDRVAGIPDRSSVVADVLAPGLADITPPVMIAMTSVLPRVEAKYGERGYRFSLLEVGHIGQNLALLAGGFGLVSTTIGGFCDAELNRLLDVSDSEVGLYLFLCGSPLVGPRDEPPVE
jgi:SagB-type dehydrogenase family enzyme